MKTKLLGVRLTPKEVKGIDKLIKGGLHGANHSEVIERIVALYLIENSKIL